MFKMFSYLFNWCAYNVRVPKFIPPDATHMLRLNSDILVREYKSLNTFTTCRYDELYIPYTDKTDSVHPGDLCHFKTITLGEFLHLIVPGESFHIDYIPIDTYDSMNEYVQAYENIDPKNYVCSCSDTTDDCVFHKFIVDKIYSKYN